MRSTTGCLTCRRRKVKCDEQKPECGQCRKAGRACEQGEVVFRHQQNPALSRAHEDLDKYFSERQEFSSSNIWLSIPETVSFVTVNPAADSRVLSETSPETDVDLSATETHDQNRSDNQLETSLATETLAHDAKTSNDISFILNPVSARITTEDDGGYFSQLEGSSRMSNPTIAPQEQEISGPVETDAAVAFLLRHFSEQPGRWLDLYFLDAYFELDVPVKCLSHPLLKSAVCAYAAKHLSRTRHKTDSPNAPARRSHVATTTTWPNSDAVDWSWYSAKYYAEAIQLLREMLQHTHDIDTSLMEQESASIGSSLQHIERSTTYAEFDDETLAAMAILCNFEFMSASDVEWTRHLNGTLLVLDLRQTGVISLMSSTPSKARKAIFWNLFRQDVYAAFILEGRTRLDIEDLRMWRAAGLELDDQGLVLPSSGAREGTMRDDMISNALIWILSKVINYIATAKEFQPHADTSQSTTTQHFAWTLTDKWKAITHELDIWHNGLPDSFRACARVERSQSEPATHSTPPKPATIPDIWYTSAICASTIQTYHLARMLLLVHRPQSGDQALRTGAVLDFLNHYRTIEAELRHRSREIFGIALSAPTTTIFLHQTQTIFVAAQCLVEDEERRMAVDILRRVNADLGWETEYRVQQLLREWRWNES